MHVLVGVLGLALVVALPWWRPADPLTGRAGLLSYAPSGLAIALRDQVKPGDRVFVPQTWGSWFEWAVPDATYFVDSRIELFPAGVWRDYGAVSGGGTDADQVLGRHGVTIVVVEPDSPLQDRLRATGGWVQLYEDADGSIFEQRPGA